VVGLDKESGRTGLQSLRHEVACYDYRDEDGTVLYQAVRYEPKGFLQRRPDSAGGWVYNLQGVRRVLYRLPELLESDPSSIVFICEGEKDAERLRSHGLVATTNAGGAGKWRDEYTKTLIGRHLCVLPDNDEPGHKHALKVAASNYGQAASVRILELPNLLIKGDVSDWLDAEGSTEELQSLAENAAIYRGHETDSNPKAESSRFKFTTLDDLLIEPEEETAYVWDNTLPRGGFSICAAKPKVGKSTLARNLAVAISRGEDFFGRATIKGKVIYLCLEEKRAEVKRHFQSMGASGADIIIHTGRTPIEALEALTMAIKEHSPSLIIIDPLSRFVRLTDFNSYGEVTRELEPLIDLARESECQCHILTLHHNGKGERESGDSLLGSTGFFGAVDTLLTMKKSKGVRTLETTQRYGEDLPETVVRLETETGAVKADGDMQTLMLRQRQEAVWENLGDESLTEGDIKERIGGNQGLTSKAVRALLEEGRLLRTGTGKRAAPYHYQKITATTCEDSRFLGSPIYENPQYPENPKSDVGVITASALPETQARTEVFEI
jgi:hypothetical protein